MTQTLKNLGMISRVWKILRFWEYVNDWGYRDHSSEGQEMMVQDLEPIREDGIEEDDAIQQEDSEDKGDQEDDEGEDILDNMEKLELRL